MLPCILMGALGLRAAPLAAQLELAERELIELKSALEQARFQDAHARARALLARPGLSARQRNDTLELLAVAQIAAREDGAAHATLSELFARDPDHRERLPDPGPNVEAAFARVRAEPRPPRAVALTSSAAADVYGRTFVLVRLGAGRDAIDTVHVFARAASEREPAHVVAELGAREALTIALPALAERGAPLELYLEARAPSGAVIAREGSREAPLRVRLEPGLPPCVQAAPAPALRRAWWFWTSMALAAGGIALTATIAAQ